MIFAEQKLQEVRSEAKLTHVLPTILQSILYNRKFTHLQKDEYGVSNKSTNDDLKNLKTELTQVLRNQVLLKSQLWMQQNYNSGRRNVPREQMVQELIQLGMLDQSQQSPDI